MAAAAPPFPTRAPGPTKGPKLAGPQPARHQKTSAPTRSLLPANPSRIPAEPAAPGSAHFNPYAPTTPIHPLPLQRKLAIGSSTDPLEAEADRVAEQVTAEQIPAAGSSAPLGRVSGNGKDWTAQRKCACGGDAGSADLCSECSRKKLQRSAVEPSKTGEAGIFPPIVRKVLRSPGQALDEATRAYFEPRFGRNFGGVRIHSGPDATESARAINARAYTVGQHLVFGEGEFNPAVLSGRRLLAHELTHTIQQLDGLGANATGVVQRAPNKDDNTIDVDLVAVDPKEAERLKKEQGIDLPKVSEETYKKLEPAPPDQLSPAKIPTGFHSAAGSAAPCPAAPEATVIPDTCTIAAPVAGATLPAKEDATLPALDESPFGADSKVETFATNMADCRAERVVQEEVNKRYKAAVESAKKSATAEAKTDTDQVLAEAVAGIDPKDKKAVAAAKRQASADAKKAADKKIAEAQAAVQKEDPDAVKTDLAAAFKKELQDDYLATMRAAVARFGPDWVNAMKAAQTRERARLTKEKHAKPKVAKGETPPPPRPPEEIAAEIEAEMVAVRCKQQTWALNQIEKVKHGWMVGRREKLDFDTIAQRVAGLKDFRPGREVAAADRVPIPESLQSQSGMPGVASEVAQFLTQLQTLEPNFKAGNYSGHGGGSWAGAGFSIDLNLTGKDAQLDDRGFYKHDNAVRFLLNLNQAATAMGGHWRVLYNDFGVAEEVNHATGTANVVYMGNNPGGTLNWHGPAPMVLHFHLDIQLPTPNPVEPSQAGIMQPGQTPPK